MSRRRRQENPISLFSFQDIVTSVTGILILLTIMLAISVITQGATPAGQVERVDVTELVETKQSLEQEVTRLQSQVKSNQTTINSWLGASTDEMLRLKANYRSNATVTRESIQKLQSELKLKTEEVNQFIQDPETKATNAQVADLKKKIDEAKKELDALRSGSRVFYNFRTGSRAPWIVQLSGKEILACRANQRSKPNSFSTPNQLIDFAKKLSQAEQYLVLVVRPSGLSSFEKIRGECQKLGIDIGIELIGEEQVVVDPETGAAAK